MLLGADEGGCWCDKSMGFDDGFRDVEVASSPPTTILTLRSIKNSTAAHKRLHALSCWAVTVSCNSLVTASSKWNGRPAIVSQIKNLSLVAVMTGPYLKVHARSSETTAFPTA